MVQSLTFDDLSQHLRTLVHQTSEATGNSSSLWLYGAATNLLMLRCLLQVMGGFGCAICPFGCFPILFEVLNQQKISFVEPNSEFFHCLQMLVFLSVLFLAYILTNGVFAVTPVILIWQRCGESVSPCLEQVGC